MHLILWRHAHAEDGAADLERRLTAAGRRDAKRVGTWLAARLPPHTRVLVSPAERAIETARTLARPFETHDGLAPGASVESLLAAAGWPNAHEAVLVIGHQPTLGAAAARLAGGPPGGYRLATASIWWLVGRESSVAADVRLVLAPEFLA